MKKNIGIITFHRSRNYGAVLQAYALEKFLNANGYNAEIIDYKSDIEKQLKIFDFSNKNIVRIIKQAIFRYRKKFLFEKFLKKNVDISKCKNIEKQTIEKCCRNYDVIISGSDQVFNIKLTNDDFTYFLDFVDNDKIKKIAYAVSAGDQPDMTKNAIELLEDFHAVSVREKKLREYLDTILHTPINIVCDPTLLLSPDEFDLIASKRLLKNKYIFLFMINEQPELRKAALKYAEEKNLILINNKNCIRFFLHSSPSDFISWIKNAECVFTNSFHGTVFSVKYHKNLAVSLKNKKGEINTRVYDFLNYLSLEECMIDFEKENNVVFNNIDYNQIDNKIKILSLESQKWLKEVL